MPPLRRAPTYTVVDTTKELAGALVAVTGGRPAVRSCRAAAQLARRRCRHRCPTGAAIAACAQADRRSGDHESRQRDPRESRPARVVQRTCERRPGEGSCCPDEVEEAHHRAASDADVVGARERDGESRCEQQSGEGRASQEEGDDRRGIVTHEGEQREGREPEQGDAAEHRARDPVTEARGDDAREGEEAGGSGVGGADPGRADSPASRSSGTSRLIALIASPPAVIVTRPATASRECTARPIELRSAVCSTVTRAAPRAPPGETHGEHEQREPGERERESRAGPFGEQPSEPGTEERGDACERDAIDSVRARRWIPAVSVSQESPAVHVNAKPTPKTIRQMISAT